MTLARTVAAGLLMGVVSDVAYRVRMFRSSLLLVDGSFLFGLGYFVVFAAIVPQGMR